MDRVSTARAVLLERKRQVIADAATPCIHCRFYELVCLHPSVAAIETNRETGSAKLIGANVQQARSDDGLCGPEGALFTERPLLGRLAVEAVSTNRGRWALVAAGLFGAWLMGY